MDLSGQAEHIMLLVGEFFPQKREIIILSNETLETKMHTLIKDSDTLLTMKKQQFPFPLFCLFVYFVVPAWKNIPLRFSVFLSFLQSIWAFLFFKQCIHIFQTLALNLQLKQKRANSFSVYEVGSNCIGKPQNTQTRTSCNQACMESSAQNFPWPAATMLYKQSLRCLSSFIHSGKKLDNAKDLPDGYSIGTFM